MLMGKQMVGTVFVIPLALGTITERQVRIMFFRPSAYGTLMSGYIGRSFDFYFVFMLPLNLLRASSAQSCFKRQEEYKGIHQGHTDTYQADHTNIKISAKEITDNAECHNNNINDSQHFYFNR